MKKWLKYMVVSLVSFIVLSGFNVPPRPSEGVYDEAGVVSKELVTKLESYNKQLAKSTQQPQIGLIVLKSLKGETIETVALQTARQWKVGMSQTNNGILVAISIEDRKMRIETSDGMATVLTDYETKQILDLAKTDFRNHQYDAGIDKIISELTLQISNKLSITLDTPIQTQQKTKKNSSNLVIQIAIGLAVTSTILITDRSDRRVSNSSGIVKGMFVGSAMTGRSRRKNRRYDDDDNDSHHSSGGSFWGGSGSSNSSSSDDWGGGGFSGGGSSSDW